MKNFLQYGFILFVSLLIISSCHTSKTQHIKTFHSNGFRKEIGKMVNGKKQGHWFIYTSTGWMERRENWKKGEWIWTITYNEKHEKIEWNDKFGNKRTYQPCGCGK